MRANTILRELLQVSISTENCGIIRVHTEMEFTEFIRQYLYNEFQEMYNLVISAGEYFYCWHNEKLHFETCLVLRFENLYLHLIQLED